MIVSKYMRVYVMSHFLYHSNLLMELSRLPYKTYVVDTYGVCMFRVHEQPQSKCCGHLAVLVLPHGGRTLKELDCSIIFFSGSTGVGQTASDGDAKSLFHLNHIAIVMLDGSPCRKRSNPGGTHMRRTIWDIRRKF
jgi:hypothetical protein